MLNKSYNLSIILSAAILTCCLTGCQIDLKRAPMEKDGKVYGVTQGTFRSRWWNYYDRGVSFLDGGFWHEAEADFRDALTMWDADQRRIRTYGRHLTDYFPHRELGIALFYQERYAEAMAELNASLSTEKSAKAEYYLDKARRLWIEQENLDTDPPEISIKFSGHQAVTNQLILTVTGAASDDMFVKEIEIDGKPVRIDLAAPEISFQSDTRIKIGENAVVAEVRDLTGKTAKVVRKIFCDRAGPTLNIDELIRADHSDDGYIIRGYAHDDSGIKEIRLNGQNILTVPAQEVVLNHPLALSPDRPVLLLIAEDQAGNRTRAEIFPSEQPSDLWSYDSQSLLLASLDSFPGTLPIPVNHHNKASFLAGRPGTYALPGDLYALNERGMMTPNKRIRKYEELGTYYALIVGINAYSEWPQLKNAVHDATVLRDTLIRRYGFSAENILFRTDQEATWDTLTHDLRYLAGGLNETDNLLIYFSGHGQRHPTRRYGYWIPVDGKLKDPTTWITNSAIRNIVCSDHVKGKNIMIIADACFSGALLRGEPSPDFVSRRNFQETQAKPAHKAPNRTIISKDVKPKTLLRGEPNSNSIAQKDYQHRILKLAYRKSRQVIGSGDMQPVIDVDEEGDHHSPFARYLLKALRENKRRIIDVEYLLYTRVWRPVVEKTEQRPVVGRLNTDMDEDGQFVLVLKSELADRTRSGRRNRSGGSESRRNLFSDRIVRLPDPTPPVIEVRKWAEKRTTFIEQALLELKIHDDGGVQKVRINGRDILRRPGRELHLNHLAALDEGENLFLIECMDQLGNRIEQRIQIHRKLQKIHEIGSRMSVLRIPFMLEGADETEFGEAPVRHLVDRDFFKHLKVSKRFNMKEPLNWMKSAGEDDILNLARRVRADFVLKGRIVARAGKKSLEISVRLIEAETSEGLTHEDVYGENVDEKLITKLCQGLVVKLRDALPLIEGRIVKIDGENIIINLGEKNQVKKGMHLIFFEEGEPVRDVTGEVLGVDTKEIGTARVRKLLSRMSNTELLDTDAFPKLRKGQQLIMK